MRISPARLALLAALASPAALYAQDATSLAGVLTDAAGAVIPGASIKLTNPSTGLSFTQKTDSKGAYRFTNLPPRSGYIAVFERAGFATLKVEISPYK